MLKATGIVRKIDELGRIVLPVEIRRTRKIEEGTPMEIFVNDNGGIVLKKYEPSCCFCDNAEFLVDNHGKKVCKTCIDRLTKVCS